MYKCCIFDLDGTLVDSIKAINYTINLTLKKYNLGPISEDECKIFVGDGYKKLVERALIHCGDKDLVHYEDGILTYTEYFKVHCLYKVKAYDGINDLLSYLKNNNIKVAVLSNKPHDRVIENIESMFENKYFDYLAGEKANIKRKPDPAGAIIISNELNISLENCLYIGDTDTDMKTGINANIDTVGVTWGFRPKEELELYNPKYLVNHPVDIINIIENSKKLKLSNSN
ncbi:HAD family hydrolase [Romboutsia sp. Marseille-P6047]|uniref:HAD family hydrolase n=1 Tax=Romboutsia sp. Marseille-P6047 TaxID=2161817 RepID=UPI000F06B26C|nr:HAD family hydrolase [Romboutsia sp. Marseille-P6047]